MLSKRSRLAFFMTAKSAISCFTFFTSRSSIFLSFKSCDVGSFRFNKVDSFSDGSFAFRVDGCNVDGGGWVDMVNQIFCWWCHFLRAFFGSRPKKTKNPLYHFERIAARMFSASASPNWQIQATSSWLPSKQEKSAAMKPFMALSPHTPTIFMSLERPA